MISITIFINDRPVITRSAVNKSQEHGINYNRNGLQKYHVDDGNIIDHNAEDGCVKLAMKMLELVNEPR